MSSRLLPSGRVTVPLVVAALLMLSTQGSVAQQEGVHCTFNVYPSSGGVTGYTRVSIIAVVPADEWAGGPGCQHVILTVGWGDGASDGITQYVRASTSNFYHQHSVPGTYDVSMTVGTECSGGCYQV